MTAALSHDDQTHRPGWRIPAMLFLGAFLLRFAAGAAAPSLMPHSNDSEAYRDLARNLVNRHLYATIEDPPHSLEVPYVTRPPLVPLALALAYGALGVSRTSELLMLAAVGALACVAIYWLGLELFDRCVALASALIAIVYPFFLLLSVVPLTESLNVLLYPLLALALVRYHRRRQTRDAVFAGVALGLSALCKPIILTFIPFILVYFGLSSSPKSWRSSIVASAFASLVAVLTIAPWTFRNYRVTGHLIPISLQFGAVLLQGSSPTTEYSISRLERGLTNGWHNPREFAHVYPRGSDPVAVDRAATRIAVAYMRENPARYLSLGWRKVRLFWGPYTHPVARISWIVVAVLSVCGLWLSRRRWRELLVLYLLIAHASLVPVFFTSMPRFRAPIEPLLILFAGQTAVWVLSLALVALRAGRRVPEGATTTATGT